MDETFLLDQFVRWASILRCANIQDVDLSQILRRSFRDCSVLICQLFLHSLVEPKGRRLDRWRWPIQKSIQLCWAYLGSRVLRRFPKHVLIISRRILFSGRVQEWLQFQISNPDVHSCNNLPSAAVHEHDYCSNEWALRRSAGEQTGSLAGN